MKIVSLKITEIFKSLMKNNILQLHNQSERTVEKIDCPFSIYTDIRKLQDKAKTSYTLSTRRLRFGYEQQFSRSTPRAYYGMVGEELTAYLILELAGAMR